MMIIFLLEVLVPKFGLSLKPSNDARMGFEQALKPLKVLLVLESSQNVYFSPKYATM
jgi:hypothetical protein